MLSLTVPPVMAGVPLGFLPFACLTAMWLILKPYGLPTDIPTPWGEKISFVDMFKERTRASAAISTKPRKPICWEAAHTERREATTTAC